MYCDGTVQPEELDRPLVANSIIGYVILMLMI